ncbi:MAG: DUF177 domain-containing protein [Candidatus Eiseniibacteriota bacterium]|nr:MAG: DUF177 domain-containing protein [Candidatus Eisenbacteria bacterium]
MKISVPELQEGDNFLQFRETPSSLELTGLSVEFATDIPVSLRLQRRKDEILVWASASATVTEECSRCLKAVERKFDVEFEAFCDKIGARSEKGEAGQEGGETFVAFHDGTTLELGPCVREAIVLSLPMKPLCSDDCKGLCPVCGANLNENSCTCDRGRVDPRWSALEKLRKKEEK